MDDSVAYRRVLHALQILRAGLLTYVLTGVMAAVSARIDGPSHVFVVLYRASIVALAAISAFGLARFALASPWQARTAVLGSIGYGVVAITSTAQLIGGTLPSSSTMVLGFGIIAGFTGTFVALHTVAQALQLRRVASVVSLIGYGALATLCLLTKLHPASNLYAGGYMLIILVTWLVGLTVAIRALRTRLPEPPRAVIHAR